MYGLKKLNNSAAPRPVFTARRRRPLRPFFFHMGPVALSITSVLLIALMAVLYLAQVGQAAVANQQLQQARSKQVSLQRENQDLAQTIAIERSPAYISEQAKKAGLVPVNPAQVNVIKIPNLQPIHDPGPDN
ncbi:septum formation initiator family protein [Dictyobacter kobayashii]|uniref:Cell division protein FtsL n=1 Tax=Dictyobacter kobayashii TaxID=2014872 RepID=A0A402AG61_9CHLR|nr:septum formation initiator family protein [Dictyobacter kobayashii]GCE18110.1 hypothetical protein KDK_19100 [Dictyobacter kobayashii]